MLDLKPPRHISTLRVSSVPDLPGTPPSGVIPTIPGRDDFALVAPVNKICPQDATRDANEQGGVCNVSLSLFCFPGFSRDSHP
jgi:hypothetical protein